MVRPRRSRHAGESRDLPRRALAVAAAGTTGLLLLVPLRAAGSVLPRAGAGPTAPLAVGVRHAGGLVESANATGGRGPTGDPGDSNDGNSDDDDTVAGGPTIAGDRSRIARLEVQIDEQGEIAQRLVAVNDAAAALAAREEKRLRLADERLAADRRGAARAAHRLAAAAVAEYVDAGSSGLSVVDATTGSADQRSADASVYVDAAAGALASLATAYDDAHHRVGVARVRVARDLARTEDALRRSRAAQAAADRAVRADNAVLAHVKSNLRQLLAALAAREAKQEADEEAMAAKPAVTHPRPAMPVEATTSARVRPVTPPAAPAPQVADGYANPLRALGGLSPSRVDQGVDYCGYGPIYALGNGVVLSTYNGGWPGGTYIAYRLTAGPAAGLTVYAAEDINPAVSIGEAVTSSTVIGTVYEGPTCIETGWADGGAGDTMAMDAQEFYGANSTAFGENFSELLESLGAPGGQLQGPVATGVLPPGWPSW